MKLDLSVTGDIVSAIRAEILAGEKAVTSAMRAAGSGLKSDWRTQITRARLGQRLAYDTCVHQEHQRDKQ